MATTGLVLEPTPAYGFVGGPEFHTSMYSLQSGQERRNADWSQARHKYSAPYRNITEDAYLQLRQLFLVCRGRNKSFLFREWLDYKTTTQAIGTGDGATKTFQLITTVTLGAYSYTRIITKPEVATVVCSVDGSPVTVDGIDAETGIATLAVAPAQDAVVTWTGQYYVPVRFDNDYLPFSLDNRNPSTAIINGTIDLIEANE